MCFEIEGFYYFQPICHIIVIWYHKGGNGVPCGTTSTLLGSSTMHPSITTPCTLILFIPSNYKSFFKISRRKLLLEMLKISRTKLLSFLKISRRKLSLEMLNNGFIIVKHSFELYIDGKR